jgi:ATP-dependent DNA helicase PIF1
MELNEEQQMAVNLYEEGQSFFLTGPGGVGKSHLIKHLYTLGKGSVHMTAMTGCASVLIGKSAMTLHSWAGIGLGKSDALSYARSIKTKSATRLRWTSVKTLIIDEVSMLTAELFDKLNEIAKLIRKNTKPFGGIQLILSGDLYQLPPVEKNKGFVFEANAWEECISYVVSLNKIIRQEDIIWQSVLNKLRVGVCDKTCLKHLLPRIVEDEHIVDGYGIRPTKMFCKRMDVDEMNKIEMEELGVPIRTYEASFTVMDPKKYTSKEIQLALEILDKSSSYKKELRLCIGAQVMLISNLDLEQGLVNGSRGVITKFTEKNVPVVQFKNGLEMEITKSAWESETHDGIIREQYPLVLAWAITIHKSQGQTLDSAIVDCGQNVFEYGQIYVALSRVKELTSLYLIDFDARKVMAHPKIKEFYESLN